ncbi:aspartate kinase [Candidatus Bathyarchaeota archaeon A05DMB-2]|jgi:aspartate kinase|nr:aspartate kinase [Candidatus Bathyarchaeota archaeon A05DMB-2]
MKIVMKFGGTSVATGERIRHVANLVADNVNKGYSVAVVVSALDGVTDELGEAAELAKKGNETSVRTFKQKILKKHLTAASKAIENARARKEVEQIIEKTADELEKVLTGISYVGELTPKSRDYVLSFGERLSAPLVWGALRDMKLESQWFTGKEAGIVTDSNFGEASPLMNVTVHQLKERIAPLLEKKVIPVVTGYIAATQDGVVTTIGRGGSDYTATILGVALAADEVWIWTDVDGIMTADPKIIPSAKMLPELSYQEAAEMAIFGAKAMHPRALEPIIKEKIPVRIRNVFHAENPGTLITDVQSTKSTDVVKAVALIRDVAMVNVSGAGMVGAPGSYAKVFEVLGKNGINIMMISTAISEANISMVIRRSLVGRALSTLEIALVGGGLVSEVTAEDDVSVVAVMGANMKGTLGVASRIFTAVARKGINIRMIAQGSSELNISFVVKEKDGENVVKAIHDEFKLGRT